MRPKLLHLTTADVSLALLLGHQLERFRDSGFDVVAAVKRAYFDLYSSERTLAILAENRRLNTSEPRAKHPRRAKGNA